VLRKQQRRWFVPGLLTGLVIQAGCGPQIYIHPLEGEDPEIVALIGAESGVDPESETTRAAKECYRLLKKGDIPDFWERLSRETQATLEKRAELGNTNALEMLHTALFPTLEAPQQQTIHVDLEALFFVRKPTKFSPATRTKADGSLADVRVTNGNNEQRIIRLKRTKKRWTLHHSSFSDLPILAHTPRALLPGHTTLSTPAPKIAPPPAPKPTGPTVPPSEPSAVDKDF